MSSFIDYYVVLGVSSDASAAAVKAAFKKLALQYHPDVYKGQDAEERMRDLLTAYQVLNDPEKRRQFDAHRSEHIYDDSAPRSVQQEQARSQGAGRASTFMRSETTSHNRRDGQGRYAFPKIFLDQPVSISLVDCQYTLSAERAQTLLKLGMLRGTLAEAVRGSYICHRCHHRWQVPSGHIEKDRPRTCPKCKASDWDEYLLLRCVHCSAVFESEQIRYEIGSYSYGSDQKGSEGRLCHPYELFPLCPACSRSHWCPVEDQRVELLQASAARKAAIVRAIWFLAAVVVIIIAVLVFSGHV